MALKLEKIKVSVVICAYNRANFVIKALESLIKQESGFETFEVIIIDNNCTDNTSELCANFTLQNKDLNYKYVIETKQGLSHARNKGIEVAESEIIAFIDDDAFTDSHYITNIITAFENYPEYGALGGKVIPVYEIEEPAWISKYLERIVSKVDYGNKIMPFEKKYPVGCNMIFRKEVFNKVGTFNPDLVYRNDDKYIFNKIKQANIKVLYVPDILVWHNIEKERTTKQAVLKTGLLNGRSERLRLMSDGENLKIMFKFFDYLFKIIAAYLLFFKFLKNNEIEKGKYLIWVMQHSLKGFVFYNIVNEYKK